MLAALLLTYSIQGQPDSMPIDANPSETHLTGIRQLTFGGQNAEAYWNADGTKIVYQTRQPGYPDEQIFAMGADGSAKTLISTGKGRTTCGYWDPSGANIYFSSTHERNEGAQKPLDMSKGYLWMVNPEFSLYRKPMVGGGSGIAPTIPDFGLKKVIDFKTYVAETTIAPNGKFMVWTSDKDGDLEIYRSDLNGKKVKRLTNWVGYDGGPFISWDSSKIVFRRYTLQTEDEQKEYKALLKEHLVRPSKLEIWIMDADGRNMKRVTNLNCASFAPFLLPDGKRIIFSSNYGDPKGREFDLFLINVDGTGLKQITKTPDFDGFPMFTRDGKRLVWASNRNGKERGETNIFTADWSD